MKQPTSIFRTSRRVLAAGAVLMAGVARPDADLRGVFEVRLLATAEPGRLMHLVYPLEGKGITVGGLAIDPAGQLYVSEVGNGPNQGSIILLPRGGGDPVRILTGLDRPSDIDITPDGTGLVISSPDGLVVREYFGITVKVHFGVQVQAQVPDVIIHTDRGRYRATVDAQGYAHFPAMLGPGMNRPTIDVIIQNGNQTHTRILQPLVAVDGRPVGHSVVEVTIP